MINSFEIKRKNIFDEEFSIWETEEGLIHREDGPAVEFDSGTKYWLVNGLLHRLDGPAVELDSGHKEWWIEGRKYSDLEYFETLNADKQIDYLFGSI